jgi:predicted nicotinamide N-methyase
MGVDNYYSSNINYQNPHAPEIIELIKRNHLTLSLKRVLDLACGTGLVTTTLQKLGYSEIIGIDPFLYKEYTISTGCKSYNMSFKDIVRDGIQNDFSCIICSFALHLCERSLLPDLIWRLSERSDSLIVISPSKFPIIGKPEVENFSLTSSKKRVHFRKYKLPLFLNN